MRPSPRRLILFAGAVGTTAIGCGDSFPPTPTVPTGVLSVFTRSEAGAYVVRPEGIFARVETPPTGDSRSTVDTCQLGDYLPPTGTPSLDQLDAGDSIVFTAGTEATLLRPVSRFGILVYAANPQDVSFVPGTAVGFAIPGASGGFPAATIASLTPPALTALTPIPARPSVTQPLTLTWQPVGDDSSRFEVVLLYATQGAANYDQQLVCEWRDDGSGTIRGELLGGWTASDLQRIEVTRYRTQRQLIGDVVLFLLATFDSVPPVVP